MGQVPRLAPLARTIVADAAVVFPAIKTARAEVASRLRSQGIDVTPFTMHVEEGTTHLAPIADHWADITATMTETMDAIFSRKADINALDGANERVNGLFG